MHESPFTFGTGLPESVNDTGGIHTAVQTSSGGGGRPRRRRRGSPAHLVCVSPPPTSPARAVLREPQPSGLGEGRGHRSLFLSHQHARLHTACPSGVIDAGGGVVQDERSWPSSMTVLTALWILSCFSPYGKLTLLSLPKSLTL